MISPLAEDALDPEVQQRLEHEHGQKLERRNRMTHESKSTPQGFPSNTGLAGSDIVHLAQSIWDSKTGN